MLETRTRITLLLPAPTTLAQHYLVTDVFTELTQVCGGLTASSDIPPVFGGWWYDSVQVVEDKILLIFADAPTVSTDPDLLKYLDGLKQQCQDDFVQDIIWITIEEINRITAGDPP